MDPSKNDIKNINQSADKSISFDIPEEGTLGILALGAVGLRAWRKVRKTAKQQKQKGVKNE